jgi:hypothetical protein
VLNKIPDLLQFFLKNDVGTTIIAPIALFFSFARFQLFNNSCPFWIPEYFGDEDAYMLHNYLIIHGELHV